MNRVTKTFITFGIVLSVITFSCKKDNFHSNESSLSSQQDNAVQDKLSNEVILDWNNTAWEAAGGAAEGHPTFASRVEAMMHIAMHDALNAIIPVYGSYCYHPKQHCDFANPLAAAASAAHTVLTASWPDSTSMLDAKLKASLAGIPAGPAKKRGIAIGIEAGKAILALREGDGSDQPPTSDWPPSETPGVYVKVPPFDYVYVAFWGEIPPFALQTSKQFRSPPPPGLNSYVYTRDLIEVKRYGKIDSRVRTADQTAYATFWYEFSDIGWNRIARTVASNNKTGLYRTARLFALLNISLADSYIAFLETKYYYKFWRPYTAIHEADIDGNDNTKPAPNWEPLLPTPPIPEYPSGHSALGRAAAIILTHFYGDNNAFSTTSSSSSSVGEVRSFKNFNQAANENADSRVMVGIHYRFSCNEGQRIGGKVAEWTLEHYLKPLH